MSRPKPPRDQPEPVSRSLLVYVLLAIVAASVVHDVFVRISKVETIPYSKFLALLDADGVDNLTLSENRLTGELKQTTKSQPKAFATVPVEDAGLAEKLHAKGVTFRREATSPFLMSLLSWVIAILLIAWALSFFVGRLSGGLRGGVLAMTKSRAKAYVEKEVKTTFADVAGVDEAKDELREVVDFLRNPSRYSRLGGHVPKGVLLVGPPGTGKTLLARAVAGEASVPFFSINGSEFVEMFVGLGAARVRDLFTEARKAAPCLLFIDEIDALGKSRVNGFSGIGSNDEKEQTLNQLLAEMDGFDAREGVILLAATNRPEILDQALLRAGRFDRQVLVGLPDQEGRRQILQVHLKKVVTAPDLDANRIAALTTGFSGADLANAVNEAALFATRRNGEHVTEADFTAAIERIVAGLEQRKKLINPDERRRVACHEMGHATVALTYKAKDPVHKVSIIPRGLGALGYTLQRPSEDRHLLAESELVTMIAVLLGGRAAEKAQLGEVSTGAADDLAKATDLARAMVVRYGMSASLGLATFEAPSPRFLGQVGGPYSAGLSEGTAEVIDAEVRRILDAAFALALRAIDEHRAFHVAGVERLLATETLDEPAIKKLWAENAGSSPIPPMHAPLRHAHAGARQPCARSDARPFPGAALSRAAEPHRRGV
jgi:cell division protease FtsH